MQRKTKAQSLVEMALILPFMLFLAFMIIDMGWYVYGYATVYNAARRGAEVASQLPPYSSQLTNRDDECAGAVFLALQGNIQMFPNIINAATIRYPTNIRKLGEPIEVQVTNYEIYPLTPVMTLGKAFGFGSVDGAGNAVMRVSTTSRRTIESLGQNPNFENGMACQP